MVGEEVEAKTAKRSSSCTNGLLWLTRYTAHPASSPFLFLFLMCWFLYYRIMPIVTKWQELEEKMENIFLCFPSTE